jgi:small subunit ribosomal protein S7
MPRKGSVSKRDVLPDPIYNSKLVTRLINKIMLDGKKGTAQEILYGAFKEIEEKTKKPAMDVFATAINNIMPEVELKVKRIGAANYQVPTEVSQERKVTLGLRWLVNYSRLRKEKSMKDKLANEIIDAANNTGASVKKRDDVIKMAEANKAYAHYKW